MKQAPLKQAPVRRALAFLDLLPRPLDSVRSIKLKLGIVIVVSGAVSFAYFRYETGWLPPRTTLTALVLGLITSQLLAHGMTSPLREMTAAARSMASGDYTRGVRATSQDEVGQLADAFTLMASDLAAADQQRRELIANVSHELRTPISALQAVLENVVDGVAQADTATMRTALAQTERLGRLVTELLDLSKIDAGALSLNRDVVSVASLVDDVVAEARVSAPSASFEVYVPADLTVFADGERLHQVVVNLVDNAARHGPTGGLVTVSAFAAGDAVVLEVRDEGPGIALADRSRIFERFTRGERAGGGGTGLGLAIARWVVDLHGGTIAVVDPGSCIRVTLPG